MPSDAAAAVVAAALLVELHAEPIARTSGAPVQQRADDTFVIELTANTRHVWLPVANHRLKVRANGARTVVERVALPDDALPGFGSRTHRRVLVEVAPSGDGCTVRLIADAIAYERLAPVIQRTLSLANSLEGSGPGLAESNLAAWRLARLLSAARATADGNRRGNLLRRAARQPTAPSSLFRELAQLAADNGQLSEAATYLRRGLLGEPDCYLRAELAQLARDCDLAAAGPADLRLQALGLLVAGDINTAEKLLHSARRNGADPAIDYQLLAHVHRHRGDETAALAAQLLAREYDEATQVIDHADNIAHQRGINGLELRLFKGSQVERASAKLYGSAALLAAPPR
tara:strand:- start:73 stop:1110 length:1038 start_codon:yes stop_codon:yes gene_type:complete